MGSGVGLVLGGGGAAGIAWEIGFLAALEEAGVSVRDADVVVGTSAGAIVGAQVCGGREFGAMLAEMEVTTGPAEMGEARAPATGQTDVRALFEEVAQITDKAERGRRLGAVAIEAAPFREDLYVAMIGGIIQVSEWPTAVRFMPVAADCETGERKPWKAAADLPVAAAVASSCSVPAAVPPVTIRGRRYIDGGVWSPSNADVLVGTGVERAVFIGPFGGPESPAMGAAEADLAEEVAALETAGIPTLVLTAGAVLRDAIGEDVLNPALRPVSVRIGRKDGEAAADRLRQHLR
ncbi:MAG TPA: patatin-like phospholipase family protein [Acidimicrobiales bacterium]|nr:patatin-like phospholipase family protein [Acidimicrobiales bacterium]